MMTALFNCISNDLFLCQLAEIKYVMTDWTPKLAMSHVVVPGGVSNYVFALISGPHTFLKEKQSDEE